MTPSRLDHLYQLMAESDLDGVVLNPGPSLTYLTGLNFHLMERPTVLLILPPAVPTLILPELELSKVETSRISLDPVTFGDNPLEWNQIFQNTAEHLKLDGKKIGVEPTRLRYLELSYLQNSAKEVKFVAGDKAFGHLRLQKDAEELAAMSQAVRIAQNALDATLPSVKPGITERELAAELSVNLLRAGSDAELPFSPIVASGPNSANPHAVPGDRALARGDLLLFDWGAMAHGYASDITRTFAIGEISPDFQQIYDLVLAANAAGRKAGRIGAAAGTVDQAARGVIQQGGYGKYFTHRTGHGLGMEAHESPYMYGENEQVLAEGMVYTVEPGIYLPGVGGVRIEDDVVVTTNGALSLTDYPRDLKIL